MAISTRRSAYRLNLRVQPGSIHRPLSDREILANPAGIAVWIEQLRRDWKNIPAQRAGFEAMGERLQRLHIKAFGRRHP